MVGKKSAEKIWKDLASREGFEEVMAMAEEEGVKEEIIEEWAEIIDRERILRNSMKEQAESILEYEGGKKDV